MLSFGDEVSEVCMYGPQHSTPIKCKDDQPTKLNSHTPRQGSQVANTRRLSDMAEPDQANIGKVKGKLTPRPLSLTSHDHADEPTLLDDTVDLSKISAINGSLTRNHVERHPLLCICHPSSHQPSLSETFDAESNNPLPVPSWPGGTHVTSCDTVLSTQHEYKDASSWGQSLASSYRTDSWSKNVHQETIKQFPQHRSNERQRSGSLSVYGNRSESDLSRKSPSSDYCTSRGFTPADMPGDRSEWWLHNQGDPVMSSFSTMLPNSGVKSNVCNHSNDPIMSTPSIQIGDVKKTAAHIEQDVINKQRHEIHLLMEELGTRDRELNDLVKSHQSQVKAWEKDRDRLTELQGRLNNYEDELERNDNHLKSTLNEMARVSEQKDMEAGELRKAKEDMDRLMQRVRENSLYLGKLESQNQSLNDSVRDLVNIRNQLEKREKELVLLLKEKEKLVTLSHQKVEELSEQVSLMKNRCEELEENNTNLLAESNTWKNKYCMAKDEADRLLEDCSTKDDNVQKMTKQLQESLQQAIALQKALFTSCEREKCKEEVLNSLRKQQKRTMQELSNLRELYDRQNKDLTLYHLSVKDKDGRRKQEKEISWRGVDRPGNREKGKQDCNMSYNKAKQRESSESGFFLKKEKKCKVPSKPAKLDESWQEEGESDRTKEGCTSTTELGVPAASKSDGSASTVLQTSCRSVMTSTNGTNEVSRNKTSPRSSPRGRRRKSTQHSPIIHETSGKSLAQNNHSKNASAPGCRSLSSDSRQFPVQRRRARSVSTSPVSCAESSPVPSPERGTAGKHEKSADFNGKHNETSGVYESSSDVSQASSPEVKFDDELTPADSDGMCHELKRDISRLGNGLPYSITHGETDGQISLCSIPKLPTSILMNTQRSSFLKKVKLSDMSSTCGEDDHTSFSKQNLKAHGTSSFVNEGKRAFSSSKQIIEGRGDSEEVHNTRGTEGQKFIRENSRKSKESSLYGGNGEERGDSSSGFVEDNTEIKENCGETFQRIRNQDNERQLGRTVVGCEKCSQRQRSASFGELSCKSKSSGKGSKLKVKFKNDQNECDFEDVVEKNTVKIESLSQEGDDDSSNYKTALSSMASDCHAGNKQSSKEMTPLMSQHSSPSSRESCSEFLPEDVEMYLFRQRTNKKFTEHKSGSPGFITHIDKNWGEEDRNESIVQNDADEKMSEERTPVGHAEKCYSYKDQFNSSQNKMSQTVSKSQRDSFPSSSSRRSSQKFPKVPSDQGSFSDSVPQNLHSSSQHSSYEQGLCKKYEFKGSDTATSTKNSEDSGPRDSGTTSRKNQFASQHSSEEGIFKERRYFYQEENSESDANSIISSSCKAKKKPVLSSHTHGHEPFTSTREPSLFKHLSQIHFCEKKRRYEWSTSQDRCKAGNLKGEKQDKTRKLLAAGDEITSSPEPQCVYRNITDSVGARAKSRDNSYSQEECNININNNSNREGCLHNAPHHIQRDEVSNRNNSASEEISLSDLGQIHMNSNKIIPCEDAMHSYSENSKQQEVSFQNVVKKLNFSDTFDEGSHSRNASHHSYAGSSAVSGSAGCEGEGRGGGILQEDEVDDPNSACFNDSRDLCEENVEINFCNTTGLQEDERDYVNGEYTQHSNSLPEYFKDISSLLVDPDAEEGEEETHKYLQLVSHDDDSIHNKTFRSSPTLTQIEKHNSIIESSPEADVRALAKDLLQNPKPVSKICESDSISSQQTAVLLPTVSQPHLSEKTGDGRELQGENSAFDISNRFEDKLSSFLEDPHFKAQEDPQHSTVPMSPATKLQRLLQESQEMVWRLERSSAIPESIKSKKLVLPTS